MPSNVVAWWRTPPQPPNRDFIHHFVKIAMSESKILHSYKHCHVQIILRRRRMQRYRRRFLLRFAVLLAIEEDSAWDEHQKKKLSKFRTHLSMEGLHRRDRRIPRIALHFPMMSAWSHLFGSGNDQALITVCGVDHHVFSELRAQFTPIF